MPKSPDEFKSLYLQIHAAILIEEVEHLKKNIEDQTEETQEKWKVVIEILTRRISQIKVFL